MMICKLVFPSNEIFKLAAFPNSFSELLDAIRARIGESSSLNFSLKYKDFEDELVTLNNQEDFQTAILSCQAEKLKTLKVFILTADKESTPKRARQSLEESSQMINSQVEALGGLIGMQVQKAVEENIKSMGVKMLRKGAFSAKKLDIDKCECVCEECGDDITGVKFICLLCTNYKCCENCEDEAEHPHPLLKFKAPVKNNQKPTAQSAHGSIQYKFNMQISPEKSKRYFEGSSMLKHSLTKSMKEKKIPYSGEISFSAIGEQPVKVNPAQAYICEINIKNTGKETWPADVRLNCVNGIYRNREESVLALEPGAQQTISLNLETPAKLGRYLSQWKLYINDEGKQRSFGESLFLEMFVEERKSSSGGSTPKKTPLVTPSQGCGIRRMRSFNQVQSCLETPKEAIECGVSDNKGKVAGYLNEIFPGELKEKFEFVNKFTDLEVQDMSRMVELYLINICKNKARTPAGCKFSGYNNANHEVSVTL